MSNDLLFSVIPRRGTVPVKDASGVTRVAKDGVSERVNEKDQEQKNEKKHADQEAMQKRHGKVIKPEEPEEKKDDDGHLDTYA
ncbi:hypothetical protein DRW07_16505 [Alteromonas sediminis]|uniref:Uncharacterized protein n=1 Tax=Alteromonas sediminis TaxID=2259342 RepID=A0A3N5Y8W8_9ALTE|nr:hypothetical protein [Alteromonas sediminis]RPJ64925.1 hypothetical protein DRW07_16505 [Alteromonas sediminis]